MKNRRLIILIVGLCFILSSCKQNNSETSAPAASTITTSATEAEVTTTEATTLVTTTEAAKEEVKLEWGMSAEQVKSAETCELIAEDTADINGMEYTLLRYKDVPFMEHNTQMTVYLDADDRLDKTSYKLTSDDSREIFEGLLENTQNEYGDAYFDAGYLYIWHNEEIEVTIILEEFENAVIYSIMPIMPESERKPLNDYLFLGGTLDENGCHIDLPANTDQTEQTEWIEYSTEGIECDPIDMSLDCEKILLEKAEILHTLIYKYLNNETDKLAYKYGERCTDEEGNIIGAKIVSDEMSNYAEYKSLFTDSIYGDYFDYINTQSISTLFDIDGVLCGSVGQSGLLGTDETWYLGYDVENDKIIGHFAELRGLGEPEEKAAEYLNDENNYWFYDITVQKMDGEYVITDCREKSSGSNYDYFNEHGLYYNSGFADRNLITNEAVKPKD